VGGGGDFIVTISSLSFPATTFFVFVTLPIFTVYGPSNTSKITSPLGSVTPYRPTAGGFLGVAFALTSTPSTPTPPWITRTFSLAGSRYLASVTARALFLSISTLCTSDSPSFERTTYLPNGR